MPNKNGRISILVRIPNIEWAMNPFNCFVLVTVGIAVILFSPKYDKFLDSIPYRTLRLKQSENLIALLPQNMMCFYRYIDKKGVFSTENPGIKDKNPIKSEKSDVDVRLISEGESMQGIRIIS